MSDFNGYPFSLPQNWGKRMDFLNFLHKWIWDTWDNLLSSFYNN